MRASIWLFASLSLGCAGASPPRPTAPVEVVPDTQVTACGAPDRFVGLRMLEMRSRDDGEVRSDALAIPAVLDPPLELLEVVSRVVGDRASFELRLLACREARRTVIAAVPRLDTIELGPPTGLARPGHATLDDHVIRLGPDASTIVHAVHVELGVDQSVASWLVLLAGDSRSARIVDAWRTDVREPALWVVDARTGGASLVSVRGAGRTLATDVVLSVNAAGERIAPVPGLWAAIVRGRPSLCERGEARCIETCRALDEWAILGWPSADDVPADALAGLRPRFVWVGSASAPTPPPGPPSEVVPGYDIRDARCAARP